MIDPTFLASEILSSKYKIQWQITQIMGFRGIFEGVIQVEPMINYILQFLFQLKKKNWKKKEN